MGYVEVAAQDIPGPVFRPGDRVERVAGGTPKQQAVFTAGSKATVVSCLPVDPEAQMRFYTILYDEMPEQEIVVAGNRLKAL